MSNGSLETAEEFANRLDQFGLSCGSVYNDKVIAMIRERDEAVCSDERDYLFATIAALTNGLDPLSCGERIESVERLGWE